MQLLKDRVPFIIQCIFNINGAAQFYGFGGKSELQPVSEPRSASGILETELSIINPHKLFKNKYSRAISSKHIPLVASLNRRMVRKRATGTSEFDNQE